MMIVSIHALELDRLAIDQKDASLSIQHDAAEGDALRHHLKHVTVAVVERDEQAIEIRIFGGPEAR